MGRYLGVWCALVFLGWTISGWCQGQDYIFHHLKVEDGLTQATNAFVYKDSRGFVWISSITGLNRFDGHSVKRYTPDITDPGSLYGENIQSDFFEDTGGDIWFCTYEAIHRYDWKQNCFEHFQLRDDQGVALNGYYVFYLDATQHLWFVYDQKELYTFHLPTRQFTYTGALPPTTLRCFVDTGPGGDLQRLYLKGQNWTGPQKVELNVSGIVSVSSMPVLTGHTVKVVEPAGDSLIWLLTDNALIRYNLENEQYRQQEIPGAEDMVFLSDSIRLIGTQSDGLWAFNTRTWKVESRYTHNPKSRSSLLSNNVTYLYQDVDSTIWASSQGVGISYASPFKRKFSTTYLPTRSNPEREIHPMDFGMEGPGHLVCFSRLDGPLDITWTGDQIHIHPFHPAVKQFPTELYRARKYKDEPYWLATWYGIFLYDHQRHHIQQFTGETVKAYSVQPVPGVKTLFAHSKGGIYEMRADAWPTIAIRPFEGFSKEFEYLPVWKDHIGRIWANENLQEFVIVDSLGQHEIARIPMPGYYYHMVLSPDSSTYWLAGTRGLFRIHARTLQLIRKYDDKDGLPASGINSMQMDSRGGLWLTHANGIIFFEPQTERIRYYGVDDGLPSLEFTQAACQTGDGLMWFGAIGSITRFHPDKIRDIRQLAIPQITRLLLHDREPDIPVACEETGATHITEIRKLCLDYRHNTLTFDLNALEYSAPAKNTVRYMMEGLDNNLIHAVNGNQIRYSNMPHGQYRLVVYASNSDGVENPQPRVLAIDILPPYYKTWWFYTLVALASIAVIAYIVYLRFSKALELQKVRLRLYENLHDDVGSRLTAIALSADELERTEHARHPKLSAIRQMARGVVDNMKRLVWAIDPDNDSMDSMVRKIRHDGVLILGEKMDLQMDIDPVLQHKILPGEIRYQMGSVCAEAFTNIAKYAEATQVRISIVRHNGKVTLTVTDNGKGFDPETKLRDRVAGSGYGLGNMQKRAARVGGSCQVHSQPGQGTRIEFTFPF